MPVEQNTKATDYDSNVSAIHSDYLNSVWNVDFKKFCLCSFQENNVNWPPLF